MKNNDKDKIAADLIRQIREDLTRVPDNGSPIASVFPAKKGLFSIERNKAEIDALMLDLMQTMTIPVEPVPSPHPLLGGLKTTFKRVIMKLMRPWFSMFLTEQVEWNESVYETLKRLHESVEYLRQETDLLNRKLDAYRLKKENESDHS